MNRVFKNLFTLPWRTRHSFPPRALENIETAIREAEATHAGEICFAVEAALDIGPLLQGETARERALEVFSHLRVWDTEQNNGVLIYLLLSEHDVEIIADRGIDAHVGHRGWEKICREMETAFREGRFEQGVTAGIKAVSHHLQTHYPKQGGNTNELPDAPVVL